MGLFLVLLGISAWAFSGYAASSMTDNFDPGSYSLGYQLQGGANGWNASSTNVVVALNPVTSTTNGSGQQVVYMGTDTTATNTLVSGVTNVWTDFYVLPVAYQPDDGSDYQADTNTTAQFYLSTNNFLVTLGLGVTNRATNYMFTAAGSWPTISTNPLAWYRFSVNHNFKNKQWAVLMNGHVVTQQVPFINGLASSYNAFQIYNGGNTNTWFDTVKIGTNPPSDIATDDNND